MEPPPHILSREQAALRRIDPVCFRVESAEVAVTATQAPEDVPRPQPRDHLRDESRRASVTAGASLAPDPSCLEPTPPAAPPPP